MTIMTTKPEDSKMALLYLIAREFNEDLNLDRILRRVLIATVRVVGATNGSFFVLDENENFTKSLFVRGSRVIDRETDVADLILQKGLAGWIKTHKQGALINDVNEDKRWYTDDNNPELLVQRSAISVPLLAGQKAIGILTVTHDKPGCFDKSDLTMLTDIADQATTAILNAQVHQLEQRRHKLSNMLTEISRQMNAAVDISELFDLILDQLARLIDYDQSIIFLINKGYLTVKTARGLDNFDELQNIQVRLYKDDYVLPMTRDYTPLYTENLQTKNTWFRDVTDTASHSWIGVPLVSNEGLEGIITVAKKVPGAYSSEDVQLVSTLASQAAIALRNTGLLNQLQAAKSRYTHLFEESSDLLLIVDRDGVILDANRKVCQILRRPKDALIGSDLALLGQNLKDTFNQHLSTLLPGKEVTDELFFRDAYGQETPIEISAKWLDIEGEEAIQWAGRDMTARHEMDKMRQDLTQMIVHDLRGPLGTLLGAIELLPFLMKAQASEKDITEALEMLQVAMRTGKTLKDLVDSMLDLTKLEQGTFPIKLRSVNLAALLAEVQDQITPQADAKRMQVTFDPPAEDLSFELDGGIIRRVLVNLIDNAIKYTQSGGEVAVKVLVDEETLTFKIIDNGPGIPRKNQKKIFDKFNRVDQNAKIQGLGLGLTFCKMAVEAHSGQIWLESKLNIGSSFILKIPRNLTTP